MKKLVKLLSILILCLMLVSIFSGCLANTEKKIYVYGTAQEPGSLNPNAADEPYGFSIYQNIYNRLVKYTNSFDIVPDLAESWEFSDDGMSLSFNLRKGVKWHDGKDFSSDDVKWTFDTIIKENGYAAASFANVNNITCPDKNMVVFNLSSPDSSLVSALSKLGVFIMPKHIYENTDWLTNNANISPIGTGPFVFKEWKSGESITCVRNNNFFGEKAKLDTIVFKFIPDENTAYIAWMNGEIDWYDSYPSEEVKKLEGNNDYVIIEKHTANVTYLTFNTKNGPFTDPALRKAVSLAINREDILDKAYQGVGVISEYYIPSAFSEYLNNNAKIPVQNIEEANIILESAGYKKDKDGFYATVDFEFFSLDCFEDIAYIIKDQLSAVGINVNLKLLEYATWQEEVINNRNFTMTLMSGNQGPTIYGTLSRFDPDSATCIAGYSSERMKNAIRSAVSSTNDEALKESFKDIQCFLADDVIILPIVEKVEFVPFKANVHGHPLTDALTKASPDELTYVYFS